ncbi:hypothetical protein BS50DRAFT_592828 [Corynespora cassiicola Philippines]|uniref:Uncharacterized protein n=1 Tax=Corynespora cassiicola Philippines TaxID=1448308 RepID=A0A2T2N7E1_CORCC|nr:hypothetical protein BS50DRAFT_592828 [Corynespora cassiicola Philippines]
MDDKLSHVIRADPLIRAVEEPHYLFPCGIPLKGKGGIDLAILVTISVPMKPSLYLAQTGTRSWIISEFSVQLESFVSTCCDCRTKTEAQWILNKLVQVYKNPIQELVTGDIKAYVMQKSRKALLIVPRNSSQSNTSVHSKKRANENDDDDYEERKTRIAGKRTVKEELDIDSFRSD